MQIRDLELYCEVATQRNVTKAAKALGLSQSMVSETLSALEQHLGVELLKRSTRPFELTPAGRIFQEGARELVDHFRRLEDRIRQLHNQIVGTVRVAAIYSVGLLQMDAYVKRFERLYPDAVLEVKYLRPDEVIDAVLADKVDLGLLSFPSRRTELECFPWQEQPIAVVVPPGHRFAARNSVRSTELDGESWVTFTRELQIRSELERWLKQAQVKLEVVHEFDNIENIKRAVELGTAIALLPLPTVRRETEMGALRAIPLSDVRWIRPLEIIHRKHKTLTAAAARFQQLLHEPADRHALPIAADWQLAQDLTRQQAAPQQAVPQQAVPTESPKREAQRAT